MQIQAQLTDQTILRELGKRLACLRLNLNLTQEDLAREAGTGVVTVHRIEQGHSTQVSNLLRVLRALGMTSQLDVLIPETPQSPIQQAKLRRKERKRASRRKDQQSQTSWRWGIES